MLYKYCPHCGNKLIEKNIGDEGALPYCITCQTPYWDNFTPAVICAVINEYNEVALLKQNYVSTSNYVLVAGIIKKGETVEETVVREIQEELGLNAISLNNIRTYYHQEKELLMNGYLVKVSKKDFILSKEVDDAIWISLPNALSLLKENGIAWKLLKEISKRKLYLDSNDIRSTAKAIIEHNGKILLNKCYDINNGHYYSLPGGGQNKYESIYDAIERECLEETGYHIANPTFIGICEEICDNNDTRINYSQYAHKFYHIFHCTLASENQDSPTETDDMQQGCQWIEIDKLQEIRLLPSILNDNLVELLKTRTPQDMGSIHIPYNHG